MYVNKLAIDFKQIWQNMIRKILWSCAHVYLKFKFMKLKRNIKFRYFSVILFVTMYWFNRVRIILITDLFFNNDDTFSIGYL
jgi:hypothetical protein